MTKVKRIYKRSQKFPYFNNGGYGAFGNFDLSDHPGKIALGEAVGNYIGGLYGNTSFGGENNEFSSSDNFIPRGLMWDLVDDTPLDQVTDPNTNTTVTDNIRGFTPSMIFNGLQAISPLDPDIIDIRSFRDNLRVKHLGDTPNSINDYNTFVDGYDVFN